MSTRQKNDSSGTCIDHIIHKRDLSILNSEAAYTNHNPVFEGLTDYRPISAVYRTQKALDRVPSCTTEQRLHFDLNLRRPSMVEDVKRLMQKYHALHPPPVYTKDTEAQYEHIF